MGCYVDKDCATAVPTSVFNGSTIAFFSYDTCVETPDCYTDVAWETTPDPDAGCPFDKTDNGWYTAGMCAEWTKGEAAVGGAMAINIQMSATIVVMGVVMFNVMF